MRRRGLSLAEVLVWMVLSFLVLGIGVVLLWQITRTTTRGSARAQAQQTAASTLNRLATELQGTTVKGITLAYELDYDGSPRNVASIQPVAKIDAKGRALYTDHTGLVVYHWSGAENVLRRRVWPGSAPSVVPVSPSDPKRYPEASLKGLLGDAQGLETRVNDVSWFRIYSPDVDPPNLSPRLRLQLETRRPAAANQPEQVFRLERSLVVRNSL